jgi:hypothetical protein
MMAIAAPHRDKDVGRDAGGFSDVLPFKADDSGQDERERERNDHLHQIIHETIVAIHD